ncbi:GDYXXLXY domain-containing protein [Comamonas sp. Y33R10-2]|uniref:GDYXXLXY domain-containing protein n=1 Tax=Comamonas sp. Y33R10-2 TaxID=2853257 RepID=UPI001C5C8D63|nr:GDYXXLXY domain-containing protein [Comamonas sp. Y33R10-2]QXZ08579.1 GDYXXLXY domain-containing protein [Comamonas sp. Y33R10-2]
MKRFSSQPHWWPAAQQQGLVQGNAAPADVHEPSVLVIAMAMLGVLVCMVPLIAFVFLGLGDEVFLGAGGMVLGLLALAGGGFLLRSGPQAFAGCAGLVLWLMGQALLLINFGIDHLESRPNLLMACVLTAAMQMLGAWLSPACWIQTIMGVGWAVAAFVFFMVLQSWLPWLLPLQLDSLLLLALWCLWLWGEPARLAQPRRGLAHARWAVFADAAIVGVLLLIAKGSYGNAWLDVQGPMGWNSDGNEGWQQSWSWVLIAARWLSAAEVLLATALLVRIWRDRGLLHARMSALLMLTGILLAVCAWFRVDLGAIALIAAAALLAGRWRIALLCGLLGLVVLGQFYYELHWPLAIKGVGVAVLGAVLLAGLWVLRQRTAADAVPQAAQPQTRSNKAQLGWMLAGAALVFGAVNWDVRGKEQVIAHGQRILVPLVPVDPRSLMQGDYMALRFDLPPAVSEGLEHISAPTAYVRAVVDGQGIATVQALVADRKQAGEGEVVLPLKRLKGKWVLVTDAYFFPEGQGTHFESGRYGDFRVLPDGRALLVGLADAGGKLMQPLPGGPLWSRKSVADGINPSERAAEAQAEAAVEGVETVEGAQEQAQQAAGNALESQKPRP